MKTRLLFALCLFVFSCSFAHAYELIDRTVDGHAARMIKIVPGDGYRIVVSASNEAKPLKTLVDQAGGVSGVNGAFFCPKDYAQCGGVSVTNALRIVNGDGKTYSKYYPDMGINGLFGFDANGTPILLKNSIWSGDKTTNFNTGAFDSVQNGIANFPIYLSEGKNMLSIYKTSDIDAKMQKKSLKNFICAKQDGTILMGGIENATVFEMPDLLLKFNCFNAINLDTGGSTAMVYNGKYVKGPGRDIMDAFVVVKDDKTLSPAATQMITKLHTYIQTKSGGDPAVAADLTRRLKARLTQMAENATNLEDKKQYILIENNL